MRMKRKVRNLGFSLVELVVAFAILGIATLGIGSLFVVATRFSKTAQTQADLYQEAQFATWQITNLVQNADEVEISNTENGGHTSYVRILNSDEREVRLRYDGGAHEIYYCEESSESLLAEYVTSFLMVKIDSDQKIKLQMTFAKDRYEEDVEQIIVLANSGEIVVRDEDDGSEDNPDGDGGTGDDTGNNGSTPSENKVTAKINIVPADVGENDPIIYKDPQIISTASASHLECKVQGLEADKEYSVHWKVATDSLMSNIVGGSASANSDPVKVNENGQITISYTGELQNYAGSFFVKAYVTIDDKTIESNIKEFKVVKDMKVSVNGTNYSSSLINPLTQALQVESGSSHKFKCELVGGGLSVYEQNVIWNIDSTSVAAGVDASISADGVLKIENYAIGGRIYVTVTLVKNPDVKVVFPIEVKGTHNAGDSLFLQPETTLVNRGEEVKVKVSLKSNNVDYKETVINAEDCNWSVSASPWLPTNYLSVGTSGIVTVGEQIPWNEEYEVTVTATWKKDTTVTGTTRFIIPATTLGR